MQYYFIHIAAAASLTVLHSIAQIFVYGVGSRLWFVCVTLHCTKKWSNRVKSNLLRSQLPSPFRLIKRLSNV